MIPGLICIIFGEFVAYINSGNKLQTSVRLLPHDDDNCAYFGSSVAATVIRDSADSDLVVVGSYGHYNNGHFENSGYVVMSSIQPSLLQYVPYFFA